jgi:phosphate-selective porin OprO/OprP
MRKLVNIFFTISFFITFISCLQAQESNVPFNPTLIVNGRVQYDLELLKMGETALLETEFRRIQLAVGGNVAKQVKYKVELGYAKGNLLLRDMFIQYAAGKWGTFSVGNRVEPTSLSMKTSNKYMPFMERAMMTNFHGPVWGSGIHYNNFHLLEGRVGLQLAYTLNNSSADNLIENNLQNKDNFIARVTGVVFDDKATHSVIHLGLNYDNRSNNGPEDYSLALRPENHTGEKVVVDFTEGGGVTGRNTIGFEAAACYKSISIQGEFKQVSVLSAEKPFKVQGYYAFVSYFLTGEHRPYKKGSFGRVSPGKSIDKGGAGALEILARYSELNSSEAPTTFDGLETLGRTKDITLGLNWYLNPYARVMYNFVRSDFGFNENNRDKKEHAHLIRFQIDF